jgi:4-hydroxy-tetrahydrodipicolinate synthase
MSDLSGIWVALITPFQHEVIDHQALRGLVAHYRRAGVHGLVALGTTGEAASLSEAEQDAVLDTVLTAADDLPVIAGLAGNHVGQLQQRLRAMNRLPLAGVLSPAPAYVRPSQAGLIEHFTRLADACAQPLVLYDIPYRTGVNLALDTLLHLAGHEQIKGIKDCGGSLDKTQALLSDGRLAVLAGDDANIFHSLCLGGHGAITAAAHLQPEHFVAMYEALSQGRLVDARQIHHELMPMIRALFTEPNPSVIKAALAQQGWCSDEVRLPMVVASEAARLNVQHHIM